MTEHDAALMGQTDAGTGEVPLLYWRDRARIAPTPDACWREFGDVRTRMAVTVRADVEEAPDLPRGYPLGAVAERLTDQVRLAFDLGVEWGRAHPDLDDQALVAALTERLARTCPGPHLGGDDA